MSYLKIEKRYSLPVSKPILSLNIFKILKDSIGKDLTRFCVPVYFNEPLSMLQKICEAMRYDFLLEHAANENNSLMRLIYVSAFMIAQYAGTPFRVTKPFNPLLGETFEYKTKDWKYVSEQVWHNPPISAAHWESKNYAMWMNTHLKTKFWGKSLEFYSLGYMNIRFKDNDEIFICKRPKSACQNILIGSMYIDHNGNARVRNSRTNEVCQIKMKAMGFFQEKIKED